MRKTSPEKVALKPLLRTTGELIYTQDLLSIYIAHLNLPSAS